MMGEDSSRQHGERFELVSGGAEGVNPDSVESGLSDLYHRAAGAEEATAMPSARATLFNLVVYARSEDSARNAVNLCGEIVAMMPCRAVVTATESRQEPHPHVDISVVCGITERGERRLCGEILLVHECAGSVGAAIRPLLMPDVPVYVWAPEDIPTGDPDFDDIVLEADGAIVDSRQFRDPVGGMTRALGMAGPEGLLCATVDLAWVALLPWREAIASHFDAAGPRRDLDQVSGIIIEYAGLDQGVFDCSAALLASWLVDRLQLGVTEVVSEPPGAHVVAEQAGRTVSIDLVGTACGLKYPGPAAVTIRCGAGEDLVSYRTDGVAESNSLARTIALALDLPKRDHIYERAVGTACELLRLAGSRNG